MPLVCHDTPSSCRERRGKLFWPGSRTIYLTRRPCLCVHNRRQPIPASAVTAVPPSERGQTLRSGIGAACRRRLMVEPDELESLSAGAEAACRLISNVQVAWRQRGAAVRLRREKGETRERRGEREWGEGEHRAIMARARESVSCSFGKKGLSPVCDREVLGREHRMHRRTKTHRP